MYRLRLLILLVACFGMASAAWADDVGYVDCSTHPDPTQVFSKARQTPDVIASIPCGESFTVLVYGFVFSRIQTRDGKIGYVFSNMITVGHGAATVQSASSRTAVPPSPKPAPAAQTTARMEREPVTTHPTSAEPVGASVTAAPPASEPAPAAAANAVGAPAPAAPQPTPSALAEREPVTTKSTAPQPAPAQVTPASSPTSAPATPPAPATNSQPAPPAASQPAPPPQPATPPVPEPPSAALPTAAQVEAAVSSPAAQPASTVPEPAPSATQPAPAATSQPAQPQPQPEVAQPVPESVRSANTRASWEKPMPAGRQHFLVELYSGYSFARFTSAGTSTNLHGAMGSFGYNLKPWLQIVGDTSYNVVTVSGVKNTLYGNHFGPRFFYRKGSRWNITPFVEALVGGSRLDATVSGVGGYSTSTNCISYKAGGGLDYHASRRWEIRIINVDYYRTTFGTGTAQNNYWASAGVVLRLFGTGASE